MTDFEHYRIDKTLLRRAFDKAAKGYDEAAVLQHEIGRRVLERLDVVNLQPATVLDLGCGTGVATAALMRRYPKSLVIALDMALSMLHQTRKRGTWWRRPALLGADLEQLPLRDGAVDLLFSNLALQWCNDLDQTFTELRRVMAPKGLLMFSSFGPDTLKELRHCWSSQDGHTHVNAFVDMHDIGDALLRAGFSDPVMDMEVLTLTYDTTRALMIDLKAIGAANVTQGRARGLTGKARLQALEQAYEAFRGADGRLPATYEIVYGHAWVGDAPPPSRLSTPGLSIPIKIQAPL